MVARQGRLLDLAVPKDSTSRNKADLFIDRGERMPSGPPLLKERRHLTDKAAE